MRRLLAPMLMLALIVAGPGPAAADHPGQGPGAGPAQADASAAGAGPRVTSFEELEISPFNAEIERAVAGGEPWAREPMQLVLRLLGVSDEIPKEFTMSARGNRLEWPDSLSVTAVMDGLADDSVAGIWTQAELVRAADGTWRVWRWRQAYRCARVRQMDEYAGRPCP